jgi:hypothetical protein
MMHSVNASLRYVTKARLTKLAHNTVHVKRYSENRKYDEQAVLRLFDLFLSLNAIHIVAQ